jgi:ribosome-binding factor A
MPSQRQERIQHLVRAEISDIIGRDLQDPRLGLVSVTEVIVSPDLRQARVYVSVYGDEHTRHDTMEALADATGHIRSELFKRLDLRYSIELTFLYDESLARGARIFELLEQVKSEEPTSDQQ